MVETAAELVPTSDISILTLSLSIVIGNLGTLLILAPLYLLTRGSPPSGDGKARRRSGGSIVDGITPSLRDVLTAATAQSTSLILPTTARGGYKPHKPNQPNKITCTVTIIGVAEKKRGNPTRIRFNSDISIEDLIELMEESLSVTGIDYIVGRDDSIIKQAESIDDGEALTVKLM
jgi:hypothetical protein